MILTFLGCDSGYSSRKQMWEDKRISWNYRDCWSFLWIKKRYGTEIYLMHIDDKEEIRRVTQYEFDI